MAYHQALDEHFVLSAPASLYRYSREGMRVGKYLVIGMLGEGLVVINLATLEMTRYRLEAEVRVLQVRKNRVIVNEIREIELSYGGG